MAKQHPIADVLDQPRAYHLASLVDDLSRQGDHPDSFERGLGKIMRRTGVWASRSDAVILPTAQFCRDLGMGTASSGGDLAFGSIQAVAAAARPQNALTLAGVPVVEVNQAGPISFAKWVKETSLGSWIAEGGTASSPNLTVDEVTANARSSYAAIRISRRLRLQSSFDVEQMLLTELAAATRAVLEDGFLNGKGSASAPLGLLHLPGATVSTWAASTPTYAECVTQLKNYAAAYGSLPQARWLASSDLVSRMLTTEKASGTAQFNLAVEDARPVLLGIPLLISEAMPNDRLLLINPQALRIVYWGAPAAVVDRMTYALAGDSVLLNYTDADIVSLDQAQVCISKPAA